MNVKRLQSKRTIVHGEQLKRGGLAVEKKKMKIEKISVVDQVGDAIKQGILNGKYLWC